MTPDEFKKIRRAAGLTQAALAERLRVNIRSVQKWEYGERRIPGPVVVLMNQLKEKPS